MRLSACWIICGALLLGCHEPETIEHYRSRGEVITLSGTGADSRVEVHHERIAAFKDRDGKPSVMDSMRMSFAFAPGLGPALAVGDKVAFEFDVHWSSGSPLVITRLETLPPSTQLVLSDSHH